MTANIKKTIKPISNENKEWITDFLTEHWGSPQIVAKGKIHEANNLPGFILFFESEPVGLITYKVENDICEIVSLDSIKEKMGVGIALLEEVKKIAKREQCTKIELITTNDNLPALGFYQKRGFVLTKIYPNALQVSRKLKPEIPLIGLDNIPLRDEIGLELLIDA